MLSATHQTLSGDQIKTTEMGGPCGTYGRQENFLQGFDKTT
jgi:hypothetical protein